MKNHNYYSAVKTNRRDVQKNNRRDVQKTNRRDVQKTNRRDVQKNKLNLEEIPTGVGRPGIMRLLTINLT